MRQPNQHTNSLGNLPTRIGQVRRDKAGAVIEVRGLTPGQRFVVAYPQLDGEVSILSAQLIEDYYPEVVSE